MGRVAGKVVVVTGAAGGQGAAEARALAQEGATVIATDLTAPELQHDCHGGDDGHGAIHGRVLDVTAADEWSGLAAWLEREHGRVDGLVNNAGIAMRSRLTEVTMEELQRVLAVNLGGALLGLQSLLPLMGTGASVVNVSSAAGVSAHFAVAYTASKWALRGLSRVASMELGPRGIRVNTILPGFIESAMTAGAPAAFRAANIAGAPLGRTGDADEVAPLIVFLISDESSYMTGAEIAIDGGLTAHGGAKAISDAVAAEASHEHG